MNAASIVSKVWSFCTTLRDDGVSYGDYLEQLTYLIFLKMADEYAKPPYNRDVGIQVMYNWQTLKPRRGNWRSITSHCCASWATRKEFWGRYSRRRRTRFR